MKFNNLSDSNNPKDKISMDVPLFIRVLERAREEIQSDVELHDMVEKISDLSTTGKTLDMSDYSKITNNKSVDESIFATVLSGMRELDEAGMMSFVSSAPTQYRSPESQTQKHRVAVTVTDPNSSAVSQRAEKIQKIIRVSGTDRADAEKRAAEYYKRSGYRVHEVNYIGVLSEGKVKDLVMDLEELTDSEFEQKYNMTKSQARELTGETTTSESAQSEENLSIGQQMARDGITYSPEREREIIGQIGDYMKKNGYSEKKIRYYMSYDEDFIPDVLGDLPRESVSEGFNGISVDIEPELDYDVVYVNINGKKYDFNYWYTDEKPTDELGFRKDIPEYLKREEWYNKLDFPTKMEVLHAVVQAELGNEPSEYKPTVDDEPLDMDEATDAQPQGFDPKTLYAVKALQAKYPHAKDLMSALLGDIDKFEMHSDMNDISHDKRIEDLEQKLKDLIQKNDLDEQQVAELTGWKQSTQPKKPAQRRPAPTAGEVLAKSNDKRSMLQRAKDAGNKNWFREMVQELKKSQGQ